MPNSYVENIDNNSILLHESISRDTLYHILKIFREKEKSPESKVDFLIFIDSDGGDLQTSFIISDMIRLYKDSMNIKTIALSRCYSSANLIFKSADERLVYENTSFMMHHCIDGYDETDIRSIVSAANFTDNMNSEMFSFLQQGISFDILKHINKTSEYWFKGIDAVETGYATGFYKFK